MPKEPKGKKERPSAVHSYLHSHFVHKSGIHPYINWPHAAVPKENSWAVGDLCKAYDWPTTAPGGGVIAIIELGGGWTQADVAQFFANAKLPAPNITDVSVDGTTNGRCNPKNDADGRGGAGYPGRRRRLRRGYWQAGEYSGLLVARYHQGHCRRYRRWLRRVLDFVGR